MATPLSLTCSFLGLSRGQSRLCELPNTRAAWIARRRRLVSQQLWALLSGLVKADATTKRTFANVARHNGFEAWRRVVEPVNENKALLRKDLLPLVTNPKAASSMEDLTTSLETRKTNKRLFEKADGKLPDAEQERLAFIDILPGDISPNVIMEMDKAWLRVIRLDQEIRT